MQNFHPHLAPCIPANFICPSSGMTGLRYVMGVVRLVFHVLQILRIRFTQRSLIYELIT